MEDEDIENKGSAVHKDRSAAGVRVLYSFFSLQYEGATLSSA